MACVTSWPSMVTKPPSTTSSARCASAATAGSSSSAMRVVQRLPADRAIHRAGVDVAEPEDVGDSAGNGTLAGPGRAVDRDDDRFHACHRSV